MKKWQISKSCKCALGLGMILFAVVAVGGVLSTEIVKADTVTSNATVNVNMSCTMSAAPGTGGTATSDGYLYSTTIDPGTHKEIEGSILTTSCNGTGNYSLYAIGYSGDSYGTPTNTQMIGSGTSAGTNIVTGTATSGGTSNWAFKLINSGSYSPTIISPYNNYANIPGDDFVKVANYIPGTTGSASSSSVQAKYQVYVASNQLVGDYTGKVKYTMVYPNDAPAPTPPETCDTPVPNLTYMQDLNSSNKSTVLASMTEDQQYFLKDKRDEKEYCVAKLKDGNIWMTQNLDLELDSTKTYTSADTDIAADWQPALSTYSTETTTWNNSKTTLESYDPGTKYWNGTVYPTDQASCEATGGTWYDEWSWCDVDIDNFLSNTGSPHYHLGNYYNWTAAVAMNDSSSYTTYHQDVNQSICPANWTLPKSSVATSGSFRYLVTQYGWDLSSSVLIPYIWNLPIKASLTASWSGSLFYGVGSSGNFWSSTIYDGTQSFHADISTGGYVHTAVITGRQNGYNVRCLAR